MILRRVTHIDSLLERLKEERVRQVIEPVITGADHQIKVSSDDFQYVLDLGLIAIEKGRIVPANPIYREVITRELSQDSQMALDPELEGRWIKGGPAGHDRRPEITWEEKLTWKTETLENHTLHLITC